MCNSVIRRNYIEYFPSLLRSVWSFVRLSKQSTTKCTSTRPTAANRDHSAEFTRTERSASRDSPHSARRNSNSSSNPSSCFRSNRDRCAAGAKCYEGVHGSDTGRYDRTANTSGNPSESYANTGTPRKIKMRSVRVDNLDKNQHG